MQLARRSLAILASITGALAAALDDENIVIKYGPSNCIEISQSSTGSCMISTGCEGVDTSMAEFGFTCVRAGKDTEWHSYGKGGFEANEEFDSGMQCDECGGPSSDAKRSQAQPAQMNHIEITSPPPPAVEYAPVEVVPADPPTQKPMAQPVDQSTVVQESWQPSLWSSVPTAMQTPPSDMQTPPPSAPDGIMPGHHASSFLRAGRHVTRAQQNTIQASDSEDADQETNEAGANANDEQSGTADSSKSESSQASEDEWVDATVVPDPTDQAPPAPPAPNDKQAFLKPPRPAAQTAAPEVERFGPRSCIATWRNPAGHCVLQTKCDHIDLSKVDVGMTCVNADGAETRHTFGKDSFDPDEEFDTMVECNKCTALRQDKTNKALTEKLQLLSQGIKDLEKSMESINANVERLNAKVFRKPALTQTKETPIRSQLEADDAQDYVGMSAQRENEEQAEQDEEREEKEDQKREAEEHQRALEAERAERMRKRCNEGNEFSQGNDC
jgi:hypothetical protein